MKKIFVGYAVSEYKLNAFLKKYNTTVEILSKKYELFIMMGGSPKCQDQCPIYEMCRKNIDAYNTLMLFYKDDASKGYCIWRMLPKKVEGEK